MNWANFLNLVVPSAIALIVVATWAIATAMNVAGASQLQDPALAVLAFYFGASVHSAGVISGANAANGKAATPGAANANG